MSFPPPDTLIPAKKLYSSIPSPRTGREVHRSVITRHIKRGLLGPDGNRHKLRAWKFAGSWYTTAEEFEDFLRRTTLAPDAPPSATRTYSERCRAGEAAMKALEEMGA